MSETYYGKIIEKADFYSCPVADDSHLNLSYGRTEKAILIDLPK